MSNPIAHLHAPVQAKGIPQATVGTSLTSGSLDLRELWRGLLAGQFFMADASYVEHRAFVTLEQVTQPPSPSLHPSDATIVERALRGERQKIMALELGVNPSTVTVACGAALKAIGNERSITRTSIVLVMAAHAAGGLTVGGARIDGFSHESRSRWVLSVENPAFTLRGHLSPSEYAVARLVVEGVTHDAIVRRRNTTSRTVSNQLASTFRKLGVSGRRELRAKAVHEYALSRTRSTPERRPDTDLTH